MAITSGIPVKSGYYWNSKRLTIAHVASDGEPLRGKEDDRWVRMPTPLVIAAAPVLGGLFVVAFPFFGAWAVGSALFRALGGRVKEGATELAASFGPSPVPGAAHLTGKEGEKKEGEEPASSPEIEKLEKEIEDKRRK